MLYKLKFRIRYFNPRPPWGGRRLRTVTRQQISEFQSTPSVGRATILRGFFTKAHLFQSTPSVGRATDVRWNTKRLNSISIHALRGEGDTAVALTSSNVYEFQSTPSVGRATKDLPLRQAVRGISIHALRGEGDPDSAKISLKACDFNPRPPWGGRLLKSARRMTAALFQSTPSVGRATVRRSFTL